MARSECEEFHVPVLLHEAVDFLVWNPGGRYVDATIGGGGHTAEILRRLDPSGVVLGIDCDPEAISWVRRRFGGEQTPLRLVRANYAELARISRDLGLVPLDGVLWDLGVSSWQLNRPERGFSFDREGPLDLRMNPDLEPTASALVNTVSEEELRRILWEYGEEREARRIARAILERRAKRPIATTRELADVVRATVRGPHVAKSLARVFQALRIAVNRELESLRSALEQALEVLRPGGRMVVIAYHSLEDRIVKSFFRENEPRCICPPGVPICTCGRPGRLRVLTRHAVRPSAEEIRRNPRARSARLRAAEKLVEDEPASL
jgi:16S rRNA (cytosine1402-N4)-methyltransferase